MASNPASGGDPLDSFDHVVVLMLENRSFDNLLGYMYPDGVPDSAPLGKDFEGVAGKAISNPSPSGGGPLPDLPPRIAVAPVPAGDHGLAADYFQPYPDPGETYDHVNTQLFHGQSSDSDPYNEPRARPLPQPAMQGFVQDYFANYGNEMPGHTPSAAEYGQIMQCYTPAQVPVITGLAAQFAVFDHWFCAVPSQTWCNRAFWNAGSSWGFVVNPPDNKSHPDYIDWLRGSGSETLFNQIQRSHRPILPPEGSLDWRVYAPNPFLSLTLVVHLEALLPHFSPLLGLGNHFAPYDTPAEPIHPTASFKQDCAAGTLPAYAFIEPRFLTPNNDMHPSSANDKHFGKGPVGSVLLGEALIWDVYEAIRTSPRADRTLLIITFDEHGGCFDHVPPPGQVTAPDLKDFRTQDDFDFRRLGVRVPTIMVSSRIAPNTIVKSPMHHGSFAQTVSRKWAKAAPGAFDPLTARNADAPVFTEVFTAPALRPASSWPVFDKPCIPDHVQRTDFSQAAIGKLGHTMLASVAALHDRLDRSAQDDSLPDHAALHTVSELEDYVRKVAVAVERSRT